METVGPMEMDITCKHHAITDPMPYEIEDKVGNPAGCQHAVSGSGARN